MQPQALARGVRPPAGPRATRGCTSKPPSRYHDVAVHDAYEGVSVDAEIAALISSGATTLIGLMATDAWTRAKGAASSLFAKSSPQEREQIEVELDQTRAQLLEARESGDVELETELESEWRSRLRRAVSADSELIAELDDFVREYGSERPAADAGTVKITGNARGKARIYQQGHGVQYNR